MKLETIGKNIDAIRKQRGYTLDELAGKVGISTTSMSRHINGHTIPGMCLIIKYAEVLGCKVGDLLDEAVDRTGFTIETDITHTYPYNIACAIAQSSQDMEARLDAAWDVYVPGLIEAIESCAEREQRVLELRFKNAMSLDEVGERFNVTRERIRQVEAKALRRLRAKKNLWSVKAREEKAEKAFDSERKALIKKLTEKEGAGDLPEDIRKGFETEDPHAALEELDVSIRLFNCLKKVGAKTIGDMRFLTEHEVMRTRSFGAGCSEELKTLMEKHGVSFLTVAVGDTSDIGWLFDSPAMLLALRKNGIRNVRDIVEDNSGVFEKTVYQVYGREPSQEETEDIKKKAAGLAAALFVG